MPSNLEKYYQDRRDNMDRSGLFDPTPMWDQIKEQDLLPPRVNAVLNRGAVYYPNQNSMVARTLSGQDTNRMEDTRDTLSHEYTHAWNENILKPLIATIEAKENKTEQEENFLKASSQLAGDIYPELNVDNAIGKLSKKGDYLDYLKSLLGGKKIHELQDSPDERQAYAIGQMTSNATSNPNYADAYEENNNLGHRNATITQDYSILMDLAARLPENIKKEAGKKRSEDIKEFSKTSKQKGWMEDAKKDLTNPFFKSWESEFQNTLLK
jgi:hypothetical protein